MPHHQPPRLFLVDGYALLYRAFYAMIARPLRTSRGENTSAAWGVANFLLRLGEKYRPDYIAWVNDAGSSFRERRYADYKSTREKLDEELQADFDRAVERSCQLLEAFRVPVVTVPGYEADDVIGTLATRGAEAGLQVVIVSGDKDFHQLIRPGIALLNPGRGGPAAVDEHWVDERNASERLGVPPKRVADFLALVGDASDNIPGVKGIGEKGAQKLLAEFGDLDTLLARAAEVSAKRPREALLGQAENARLSRELVTILCDVPAELDLQRFAVQPPDRARLAEILSELEFFSLVRRVGAAEPRGNGEDARSRSAPPTFTSDAAEAGDAAEANGASPPAPAKEDWLALSEGAPTVTVVTHPAELPALAARLRQAPMVALDSETDALSPRGATLVGLALAASDAEVWYLPFGHRPGTGELAAPEPVPNLPPLDAFECAPIAALLRDASVPKAAHDLKYDWQVLRGAGVELEGAAYDSMLASFVLDPGRRSHAIDTLALEHFGRAIPTYGDVAGRGRSEVAFQEVAVERAAAYAGAEAATVLALRDFLAPSLTEMQLEPLLRDLEMPLVPVLVDMEWTGIAIDPALFARLSAELGAELMRLEADIARLAGGALNLNSPRQLASVLFEQHQLPVLKKTKTGPSTDADVLEQLAAMGHQLPQLILEYRELQKLKGTYVDAFTPASIRPGLLRGDSRRRIRISRTFRCGHPGARRSGAASFPRRAAPSWSPTTRRSSCG
jgi:DNA polymerase-1